MIKNEIHQQLVDLGISTDKSIEDYHVSVRDRNDISVLKCNQSNVIFLSRVDHMDISHYEQKEGFRYWSKGDRQSAINIGLEDLERRAKLLKNIVTNKKWIDIGTGSGGILDEMINVASSISAVEPQKEARENLKKLDFEVYPSIEEIKDNNFEVVTLFHVFEHLVNPLEELKKLHTKMSENSRIVIEVPHANDFLLSFLENESFKKFTFWSEHLILHTRLSLQIYLEKAGFKNIVISGFQRYPLANHIHWLSEKKPGGHNIWDFLRTDVLDCAYSEMLSNIDKNDTLIAYASK